MGYLFGLSLLCFLLFWKCQATTSKPKHCNIYCEGPLLHAVQTAHLFKDSKHFVDMSMKKNPDVILKEFSLLPNKTDPTELRKFVESHFRDPGDDLESCNPDDFVPYPQSFLKIKDPSYRLWAYELHLKWRTLCRKVKDDVKINPNRYSLIPVPHPFVAPGGRFREFYYWDSYWIIKGLLASEMYTTAKNMIRNLAYMVKQYGFVPNGGRIYFLNRSQPPLLPYSVQAYYNVTKDEAFVREMLPILEKEHNFWVEQRVVEWPVDGHLPFHFYRYNPTVTSPRPESYREDIETADHLNKVTQKHQLWSDIAAACESGWDFSSRWFSRTSGSRSSVKDARTTQIIPVDLNAFICGNQKILSDMYRLTGNDTMTKKHQSEYNFMKYSLHKSFWNEDRGSWFDLDMSSNKQTNRFYASNPTPLFTTCIHNEKDIASKVFNYLESVGATSFAGGIPTSFELSGEQWDSPNGWAPTNHILMEGLEQYANSETVEKAAFDMVDKWIQTNYFVYLKSGGKMFEKYNVELEYATSGSGGEYEVQEGFGWTNGVVLDLLLKYGDRLRAPAFHSFHAKLLKFK